MALRGKVEADGDEADGVDEADLFPPCAEPGCTADMREAMCPNSHRTRCLDHCGEVEH